MHPTRTATTLIAALSIAGCFTGSSSKSTEAEKEGQLGVFYLVNVSRPVGGTITTPDGQLNCGTAGNGKDACGPATFSWNVKATLSAVPDAGKAFVSWAGDCGGNGSCVLDTVSSGADKWVVAVFNSTDRLGHASIPDPAQHGPLFFDFVKKVPNTPQCNTCHGTDYKGLANATSCESCHATAGFPNWVQNCGFCHGDPPAVPHVQLTNCSVCHTGYGDNTGPGNPQATNATTHMNGVVDVSGAACTLCHGTPDVNAAPPLDTQGRTATTFVTVGAHQAHLNATIGKPVACGECHTVPADVSHATNPPASKVKFGDLADKGTTTVWNAGTATCASTYCHGGSSALAGGLATTPIWTAVNGLQKTCTSCHGAPPPAPHPNNADCGTCHTGYSVVQANPATHIDGVLDVRMLTCTSCHGDPIRTGADPYVAAAPPLGTQGETVNTQPAVGAHMAHLSVGALSRAFACTDCHSPPTSMAHANGAVEFSFSVLAGGSGVAYDATARTCSNTYCHGNFVGGNATNRPVWTAGAAGAACGSCHGSPPPAPHTQSTACGSCHAGYTATSVNTTIHVNGIVDVVALNCTSCHGTPNVNAAPPFDANGRNATTLASVGAHQSHVRTTLMASPVACTECHGSATTGYGTNHADGTVQIQFGLRSNPNPGTQTVWNGATCASNYCHGGTGAVAGGTGTTPAWTTVNGTFKSCGSCHGAPPPAPHAQNADCGSCHPGYTSNTVAAAIHLNGSVDVTNMSCTSCHGDAARSGLDAGGIAFSAAPPADVAGLLTGGTKIGAHAKHLLTGGAGGPTWSKQVACSECHQGAVPVDPLHANGQANVAFGTLATTGAVTPAYAGNTCSNTYCHGNFANGAGANAIAWSAGSAACGSCHANPPGGTHPAASLSTCGNCHPNYDNASQSISNAATHVDGNLDVTGMSCTSCHGATGRASVAGADLNQASAPPVVASATGVAGAHLAHVNQGSTAPALSSPMGCSNCHVVPSSGTHANAVVAVIYGGLSVAQGAAPSAYDGAAHTCSNTYCHGNFPAGNRSAAALSWSASGKLGCTACHGAPPALSAASHHPANSACATCHGTGYSASTVVAATHVDGTTALTRSGCTLCHGDLTQTGVAATAGAVAPGFNDNAADTAGNTTATFAAVGAHKAHLTGNRWRATALACSECHTVPGTGDVAHATGSGTGGARATIAFGTLARTGNVVPAYAGSTTASGTNGAGTCSNTYCHGNFTNGTAAYAPSWLGGPSAAACGSCHGDGTSPRPGGTHPASDACENCHTGYTVSSINPANHLNGSVQSDNLSCTSCHGQGSRGSVAGADVNQASAPPLDALGASAGVRVGVHLAHVNPAVGAVYKPIACVECHPNHSGNNSHANSAVNVTFAAATGANLGSYTPAFTLGDGSSTQTTCATYCHGATMAPEFAGSVSSWTWNSPTSATCGSCHAFPPSASHTGVLAAATDCNRCHGGTVNPDGSINVAGGLHINGQGDGGGEPTTGGSNCGGCHTTYFDQMTATAGAPRSRHGLGSDLPGDNGADWTAGTDLVGAVALANRTCVTMCHTDHPHTAAPVGGGHSYNVYADASQRSGAQVGTDFDATFNTGLCASCHQKPIVANGISVSGATFGTSAHDFTTNTVVGGATYTWSYALHDGSSFARNCTKCHASRVEGTTPGSSTAMSVHFSAGDVNLLAGTTNPGGSATNFACYNCHGSTAAPASGVQGNRSGKNIQGQIAKGAGAGGSGHPSNADSVHDSAAEFANASFGNALGVAPGAGQRHASCMDCHDTHAAKAGTHVPGTAFAGPPLQGAWGAKLSTNPAFWTAPLGANFTKTIITAGTDLEATLCFKCHTGYYWGTGGTPPTSPSGGFAETDQAKEFNPANVGNYPGGNSTDWEANETAGGFHPVLASAGSNLGATSNIKAPWTRTSRMTCTDCHESDSTTDPSGPHGSAARFLLKGPNTSWSNTLVTQATGMPTGTFCINCHNQDFTSSRFSSHSSRDKHRVACFNCHAAIPHGGPRPGMLVAPAGAAGAVGGLIAGWDTAAPYSQPGSGSRLYLHAYPTSNTQAWQESNCGCNGSGH